MILEKKNKTSYYCSDPDSIAEILTRHGYMTEIPGAPHVISRMRKSRSIVITYSNGTVLLQGVDIRSAHEIFDVLIAEVPF